MTQPEHSLARLRTRWSAIGAAVAITLGAGGIGLAQAAVDSGDKPITVTVDSKRILDTRINLGLAGGFAKDTPREVQVTGPVTVATATGTATETVVPAGATAVLVNVTVVFPTDQGFLTLRAGGASGAPSTSTVNFQAGTVEPNAATVDLSADGKVQVWVFMPDAAAKADVLIDVVGYTVDHNHDDRYYTEAEVDAAVDAAVTGSQGVGWEESLTEVALVPDAPTTVLTLTTDVPADGYLVVDALANLRLDPSGDVVCWVGINSTALNEFYAHGVISPDVLISHWNDVRVFEVDAGMNTINLVCRQTGGTAGDVDVQTRRLVATFTTQQL